MRIHPHILLDSDRSCHVHLHRVSTSRRRFATVTGRAVALKWASRMAGIVRGLAMSSFSIGASSERCDIVLRALQNAATGSKIVNGSRNRV